MNISSLYDKYLHCSGVSTDTRTINDGELFIALKGPSFDGNRYANLALKNGAQYVLVDDSTVVDGPEYILCSDALVALQELATYHRKTLDIPVIGITGSNGKTTTKELIVEVLSADYKVSATKGNYNNHIGVPLTILNADKNSDILIVEMGTNQPGDIKQLCDIAHPNYGLITNIGASHLELLGSITGVFKDKSVLYHRVLEVGGVFFLNKGDDLLISLESESKHIKKYNKYGGTFGSIKEYQSDENTTTLSFGLTAGMIEHKVVTQLFGSFNLENIVAALEVGHHFNVDIVEMSDAISSYVPTNMRSQLVTTQRNTIILDAYNANPTSMKACLEDACAKFNVDDLIVIIGDMLELGIASEAAHIEMYHLVKSLGVQNAIFVGRHFNSVKQDDYQSFISVDDVIETDILASISHKKVLVKASRGINLEKVVSLL